MTPEEFLDKGKSIMGRKSQDYTTSERYENFTRSAEVSSWFARDIDKVFVTLITVKLARLASLLGRKEPNNESIEDTFTDLINYSALWGGCFSSQIKRTEKIKCPFCKTDKVTQIYKPEVYEYSFFCRECQNGFN
jgi:hypothetical protein